MYQFVDTEELIHPLLEFISIESAFTTIQVESSKRIMVIVLLDHIIKPFLINLDTDAADVKFRKGHILLQAVRLACATFHQILTTKTLGKMTDHPCDSIHSLGIHILHVFIIYPAIVLNIKTISVELYKSVKHSCRDAQNVLFLKQVG